MNTMELIKESERIEKISTPDYPEKHLIQATEGMMYLSEFCKRSEYPSIATFRYWISLRNEIARKCLCKIGGRYMIRLRAWEEVLKNATLDG